MFRDGAARVLVFRLGDERFAVSLASVEELVDVPAMHALPDAPPHVLGVATIRGALVTVYDPRPALNIGGAPAPGALLLFTRDDRRVALAVDDVQDALTVEEPDVRAAPGVDAADGVLLGVVRRGGVGRAELVALLDARALLDAVTMVSEGGGERT